MKPKPKPMRNTSAFLVLATGCLALAGCTNEESVIKPSDPPKVRVALPVEGEIVDRQDFTGRTDAVLNVDVTARVGGYLSKVLFVDGSEVKEGDPLFEIDARPYQAAFDWSEANARRREAHFKRMEADYQRASKLMARGGISAEEYDLISGNRNEAEALAKSARAACDLAKQYLEWTKINAKISGVISSRMVDPGGLIKAESTVMTNIVSQNPLYIYFDVDERTLLRLRRLIQEGEIQSHGEKAVPVLVGLADEDDFPRKALIDFTENKTDPSTGTLRVRGTMENPPPHDVSAGMFVSVRLPIGTPHKTLFVPPQALGMDQGRRFVYVVNGQNEVVYRPVRVGPTEKGLFVIEEGLKPDDRVVVSGVQRLKPGLKVVPELDRDKMLGQTSVLPESDSGRAGSS